MSAPAGSQRRLSDRCKSIVQSEIRGMSLECDAVGGINLAQGVCDTDPPELLRAATKQAVDSGPNSYTRYDGIRPLREALSRKLKTFNGIEADPESEIVVSAGSTGAFYSACLALLNPGDEVVLFEPYYGYHVNTLLAVGSVPTYVRLSAPEWQFDADALTRSITPKTRAIMINTPGNPSGKVWSDEEFDLVGAIAEKHDLIVFTDEIYEYIVYDGKTHKSPAANSKLRDRCVTISGYSKTFSITGWRIGYTVSNPEWARMIGYMNDLVYVCAPAPLQAGVAEAVDSLDDDFYRNLSIEFQRKRDLLCTTLKNVGLTPHVPQGAYYILADVSRLPGSSGKDRAMHLLNRTGIASVPGEAFFSDPQDGAGLVRFCYAKSDSELEAACAKLRQLK